MNLEDFFSGLDHLFAKKDFAAVENYLAHHLETAMNYGNSGYQLAVLNEQAGYYRNRSLFAQAFAACEQAMAIISAPEFSDPVSAATTMLNVATSLQAGGRVAEALEMYGTVEGIYAAALDANDPRRAALYNNMAQACMSSGDKQTALEHLHRSLAILKTSRAHCAELATTHSNIALLYLSLGDNEAAATHLQAALSGFEALGYDAPHYPAALAAMAQLLHVKKDYAGAVEQYRLALAKTEALCGHNANYALICRNCARACSMAGLWTEAGELERKAEAREYRLNSANAPVQTSIQ